MTSNGAGVDERKLTDQWASLWRNLILSTFSKTYLPYYRYIRVLSLRDLAALLDDQVFREQYSHDFFQGDLENFAIEAKGRGRPNLRSRVFNIPGTVEKIGDRLTQQTTMIEELDCNEVSPESLSLWIPRLKRLQQLRLWNGTALIGTGSLLKDHCPEFTTLKFFMWPNEDADDQFAIFLNELQPKDMKSVEIFSYSNSRSNVITSLSAFCSSLTELKLGVVQDELLLSLSELGPCPLLTTLHLESRIRESVVTPQALNSLSSWFTSCPSLTDLRFINDNLSLIPKLFTPFLLDPAIKLQNLEITRYDSASAREFHAALSSQASSLRSLILRADGETCDCEWLVKHLCRLTKLKDLHLFYVSDFFNNAHIRALADSMPELEELVVSGWNITDSVWWSLSKLKSLHRLDLNAFNTFTLDGILEYISDLGPGNAGLSLSISMADSQHALSEPEQNVAREMLAAKVEGGRFDYTLARGRALLDSEVVGAAMKVLLLL